jgi:hypothetical protein
MGGENQTSRDISRVGEREREETKVEALASG